MSAFKIIQFNYIIIIIFLFFYIYRDFFISIDFFISYLLFIFLFFLFFVSFYLFLFHLFFFIFLFLFLYLFHSSSVLLSVLFSFRVFLLPCEGLALGRRNNLTLLLCIYCNNLLQNTKKNKWYRSIYLYHLYSLYIIISYNTTSLQRFSYIIINYW